MNRLKRVTIGLACAVAVYVTAQAEQSKFAVPSGGSGCFDFEALNVGKDYGVGKRFETRYGPVELVNYSVNQTTPTPNNPGVIRAQVNSSSIAGSQPEILFYLISAHFVPDKPLKRVTFDVAESWAGGNPEGAHHNLGINGQRVEVPNTLESIDGLLIGQPALGKVRVNVDMTEPAPGSNWAMGTVVLEPVNGGTIKKVKLGGRQTIVDNFCFEAA
jgi:hypothetical protein